MAVAYDILTGSADEIADKLRGRHPVLAGWAGPDGPAIDPHTWPRAPRTGERMDHLFTLRLPGAYQRQGPLLPGVSVFEIYEPYHWRDDVTPETAAVRAGRRPDVEDPDNPFWAEWAAARPHPTARIADDGDALLYALVWLTEAELTGTRTAPPSLSPRQVAAQQEHDRLVQALRRESHRRWADGYGGRFGQVWLAPRDDPNAGIPPRAFPLLPGEPYVRVEDMWEIFNDEHLGGTSMNADGPPVGLSPWYIEINRLGGVSHGGDNDIAFDLDTPDFLRSISAGVPISTY